MITSKSKLKKILNDNNHLLMYKLIDDDVTYNNYNQTTVLKRVRGLLLFGIDLTWEILTVELAIRTYKTIDYVMEYVKDKKGSDIIHVIHYNGFGSDYIETYCYELKEHELAKETFITMLNNIISKLNPNIYSYDNRYALSVYDNVYQLNMRIITSTDTLHTLYFYFPLQDFIIDIEETFIDIKKAKKRLLELGQQAINNTKLVYNEQ